MNNIIINTQNCMSRKNMNKDINKQCDNKRKYGEYCGLHKNGKCKLRIDEDLDNYNNNLKNITLNELKKKLSSVNLSITGNKRALDNRYKIYINTLTPNLDKIIKIQKTYKKYLLVKLKKLRGPGLFCRKICNNETDFYSMDSKNEILSDYFFSYKDSDNFIYCFDIRSFKKLIDNNSSNPYNRNKITNNIKNNFNKLLILMDILNIKLSDIEKPVFNPEQAFDQKILKIFQEIDTLGFHTDINWFKNLSIFQLKHFYKSAEDIWNYRANLDFSTKLKIIPDSSCFKYCIPAIYAIHNYKKLRNIVLNEIEKFVTLGITKDDRTLGTMYMLTALTEVSQSCAEAMPWLLQI